MIVIVPFMFFFFQAEDGIRDHCVTGVQTCALPISFSSSRARIKTFLSLTEAIHLPSGERSEFSRGRWSRPRRLSRSEERRVGKECRSRWQQYHEKREM